MKLLFVVLIAFGFSPLAVAKQVPKVLIVLNNGYRPEEYFVPRKLFDDAGFEVNVAAHYPGKVLPSRPHIGDVPPVEVDEAFDKVTVSGFDAVVFVGGNGAWNDLLPNPEVHRLLLESVRQGKIMGLIRAFDEQSSSLLV